MNNNSRTSWTVLAGLVLIVLGAWLLLVRFFAPLFYPLQLLIGLLARVGWPLVLIGVGILLILRARGGGFTVSGKKLYRSRTNRMVAGVLGGFASYLGVDATIVRVVYAFLTLFTALWAGVLLYVIAMIVVPEEPYPAGWEPAAAPAAPPPPAPPVPGPAGSAPTPPPVPPAEAAAPSEPGEPPQAPPIPPAPPVL